MTERFFQRCCWAFAASWCALVASAPATAQTSEVVDLPSRPGVTQRMLLITPAEVKATVVLLVGGHGGLQLSSQGRASWGNNNFLARTAQDFAAQQLAVALVDAPSDRQTPPYLSGFRQTAEHAEDLKAVMAHLRQRYGKPVLLVGTSRGTQSAGAAALALQGGGGPDGLVLTSSILTDSGGRALTRMPLENLTIPVLAVHHEQDACRHCRFSDFPAMTTKIKSPLKVLTYRGGNDVGEPCEAMAYHGFNGLEAQVVNDIGAWIRQTVAR
ncbi:MAG: alpha/beta hydrolase [Pseudomonadota bacterium]